MLSDLHASRELQVSPLERYDNLALRREIEAALFAIPLSLSRYQYSKDSLRTIFDSRCIIDGNIQETARWPTECQVTTDT